MAPWMVHEVFQRLPKQQTYSMEGDRLNHTALQLAHDRCEEKEEKEKEEKKEEDPPII